MKSEKLNIAAEISAAARSLGDADPEIEERELDGGGWMTEFVIRLDDEDVELDVMHYARVAPSVRLTLEGWQFEQVAAADLRQVITKILSGEAVIKTRRTFLRRVDHVLEVASPAGTYYGSSESFSKERAAAWETRLLLTPES
ncbi:hypothetical protein [Streptomyces sp. NPDC056049]|uniref:hypothetical protein n=1 Tax=Streptomyces sp. NPDC056049 TaxID=3345693 RepID=UPI0035D5C3EC